MAGAGPAEEVAVVRKSKSAEKRMHALSAEVVAALRGESSDESAGELIEVRQTELEKNGKRFAP